MQQRERETNRILTAKWPFFPEPMNYGGSGEQVAEEESDDLIYNSIGCRFVCLAGCSAGPLASFSLLPGLWRSIGWFATFRILQNKIQIRK